MPTFKARKLCAAPAITPAGTLVEIDDQEIIDRLLELECIEPFEGDAEAEVVGDFGALHPGGKDDASGPGDLDADAFVAWVADGAKVGEVTDWIGDDLDRAAIAEADGRATVQKHIEKLLEGAAGDDEDGDDEDAAGDEEE